MWRKKQVGWAVAVLCSVGPSWGQTHWATPSKLDVVVFNDATVDPQTVREAENRAAQIFRTAEIEVHWIDARWKQPTTLEASATNERGVSLDVRILPRSRNLAGEVFGLAFVGKDGRGQQADIFYDGIAKLSGNGAHKAGVLLGAVLAHELGHLLLGSNSHSATGIMQGHWRESNLKLAALGEFGFLTAQAVKMQSRIETIEQEGEPAVGDSRAPDDGVRAEVVSGIDWLSCDLENHSRASGHRWLVGSGRRSPIDCVTEFTGISFALIPQAWGIVPRGRRLRARRYSTVRLKSESAVPTSLRTNRILPESL